jgi:hypothetical protein
MTDSLPEIPEKTIQQIFDEDPLKLSDKDIDQVITYLRTDRERWLAASAAPKAAKPAGGKKIAASMEDLFGGE